MQVSHEGLADLSSLVCKLWCPDISRTSHADANAPFRRRCAKWPDRRSVSTLNDVRWKWANRAARAGIVAHFYRLALLFLEPVQRKGRNVTQLPLVVGVFRYCIPCPGKTIVRCAEIPCWDAPRMFQGRRSLAAQPGQFGAPLLRVGLTAKSDQRHHRKG